MIGRTKDTVTRMLGAVALALAVLAPATARAHKLSGYAGVEDGRITVHAYFSRGTKARGAKVRVFSESGKMLLETKTDEAGRCSFVPPAVETLRIVVDSADGHSRELTVDKSRLEGLEPAASRPAAGAKAAPPKKRGEAPGESKGGAALNGDVLARIARLRQSVNELRHEVIQMRNALEATKLRDVAAGVGFIFGLFGVAAYFLSKRGAGDGDDAPSGG